MITGRYQDTVVTASGRRHLQPWRGNLVVNRCYELVAALMKEHPGSGGVLWWAFGSGEPTWDDTPPRAQRSDRGLRAAELRRQQVFPEHMRFVDEVDRVQTSPTHRVEVRGAIAAGPLGGRALREFGLFGGDATRDADTGIMINHVIHAALTLEPGELLERRLILTFGELEAPVASLGILGSELPVRAIKGIDVTYARVLEAAGVTTVLGLSGLRFDEPLPGIPPARFREFVDKARMVCTFHPFGALVGVADWSVLAVLELSTYGLTELLGVSEEAARDIQHSLGPLQVALDADVLRDLPVRSLFSEA